MFFVLHVGFWIGVFVIGMIISANSRTRTGRGAGRVVQLFAAKQNWRVPQGRTPRLKRDDT